VTVTWDAVNCVSVNYHLLYGKGENLPSWTVDAGVCGMGTSGPMPGREFPNPSTYTSRYLWFLVVGDDGSSTEGSWGLTSPGGAEEGGASASNKCGIDHQGRLGDLRHSVRAGCLFRVPQGSPLERSCCAPARRPPAVVSASP